MKDSFKVNTTTSDQLAGPGGQYDGTYIEDYKFVSELGRLDEHNGHLAVTPEYPDGIYHYHAMIDNVGDSEYPRTWWVPSTMEWLWKRTLVMN